MRRQIGILVGLGVVLVVALFLVTSVSKELNTPDPESTALPADERATDERAADERAADEPAPAEIHDEVPLPPAVAEQAEQLEADIEAASGSDRVDKQRELVNLYVGIGRFIRAAQVQEALAAEENTAEAWRRAGDLYYDWMDSLQDQSPDKRTAADQAVQAYQQALALDPDNLDVRTDMATAYLNSNNPMQGVQEIKRVLDEEPNHLQARFNYGIMLSMINRPEQAIEQFEAVQRIVGEDSPYYRQAQEAIAALRQQLGS